MRISVQWSFILLMAALSPRVSQAQFFKNLVNNAKQSMTNKAAGNAAQTPVTPDSSAQKKPTYDSAFMSQYLSKLSKPKPSISPADSAAAIKNFMTATGGSGMLYQYRVHYIFKAKKDSSLLDTMSLAIADNHNVRTDMGMLGMKMQVLGHAGMPHYSIIMYPASKTYTFNIIDTAAINSGGSTTYQVTKIGSETVAGYNCIHSKMTIITSGQKNGVVEDVWTSPDVPGYAALKKLIAVQNVTPKMMQAMDQAGCGGFFVKMTVQSKDFSMDMSLFTAADRTFPASIFEIPPGYTQGSGGSMFTRMMMQKK